MKKQKEKTDLEKFAETLERIKKCSPTERKLLYEYLRKEFEVIQNLPHYLPRYLPPVITPVEIIQRRRVKPFRKPLPKIDFRG